MKAGWMKGARGATAGRGALALRVLAAFAISLPAADAFAGAPVPSGPLHATAASSAPALRHAFGSGIASRDPRALQSSPVPRNPPVPQDPPVAGKPSLNQDPSPSQNPLAAPWRAIVGRTVTARYQGRDSARAHRAVATIDALGPLPALGEGSFHALLTVAPTRAAMDTLVGGRVPEWAGAVAIADRMEIIVPSGRWWPGNRTEEVRVLRHEWAHLALAHRMGRLRIPRWFNEGYAEWAAGRWDENGGLRLAIALASGSAPPLDSITLAWPRDPVPASAAYLLSASMIQYLVQSSGTEGLEAFLARWKERGSFDDALRIVYGATPGQIEADWRTWVRRRYGWLMVVSHSAVFWSALAMALAAMFLYRRRYRRIQLARLRATEPPDAPSWWTAPDNDSPGGVDRPSPSR